MDPRLRIDFQGHRLPQRRFASTRFRVPRTLPGGSACLLLAFAAVTSTSLAQQASMPPAAMPHAAVPHAAVNLTAAWQPLGPSSIASPTYNNLTGRIAAIATDPNDATGNTVYFGATGGGVWKSTNAAGPSSAVTFTPLTDTLPVFSSNAGLLRLARWQCSRRFIRW